MQYKKLFKRLSASLGFTTEQKSKNDIVEKTVTINQPATKYSNNMIFEIFSGFINDNPIDSRVFMHFTRDRTIADSILENGFKFADCFYKTTQEFTLNKVDLNYKFHLYKDYGTYLIVFSIPKDLFENSPFDEKLDTKISLIENGFCDEIEDDYFNYILPAIFINGYFDLQKNSIIRNEKFMKGFDLAIFKTRIKERFIKRSMLQGNGING